MRTLRAQGRTWTVWEVSPEARQAGAVPSVDPDYLGGWLVFQCEQEKRRFAPPPPGWAEMADADLTRLLRHAVSATRQA